MKINSILMFLCLFFITSCENSINWDLDSPENEYYVIEGIITNEYKNHKIIISKTVSNLNQQKKYVSDANVWVDDGINKYFFTESEKQPGVYFSDKKFVAAVNRTYTLSVICSDKTFSANSDIYPVTDFEPVSYNYNENKQKYFLTSTPDLFNPIENAMYKIIIEPPDSALNDTTSILYFYSLTSLDIPEIFASESETVYFTAGSIITQRKYSLTPRHAEFYRSLLLETTWRGNIFDVQQGNVTTNLTNGALGYFGACSVIEKSFKVEP